MISIFLIGGELLKPFFAPYARLVQSAEDADLILAMNSTNSRHEEQMRHARAHRKPIAWWTIEDPNWFGRFLRQASLSDFIFTSDEACITRYEATLGHRRVHWLPLACSPEYHRPLPLLADCADLILSANWYSNRARRWSVSTVVDPLISIGRSLALFSFEAESFRWPERYLRFWQGQTHYLTVAEQYRTGRLALGLTNQRSGLDGFALTYMTSMRTFEALACGKPLLTASSDAFERLGFVNGEHLVWVDNAAQAVAASEILLDSIGLRIAENGRRFVIRNHTYWHRLKRIGEVVLN